jgi:electron transfer flavoprotein alpha subunit
MQVFVIVEQIKGEVDDVTYELLGKGAEIASSLGGELVAVLLGSGVESLANKLGKANKVIYVDDPQLAEFNPEAYNKVISAVVAENQPKLVLVGYTSMGMDIGPGLSVDQDYPLVTYANDLSVEGGSISVISQLYGGKMNVESEFSSDKCIVSVIPGSFSADNGRGDGSPEVVNVSAPDLSGLTVQFKSLIEPEGGDVDITAHDILVSVGRGIQNDENLPMMEELAAKLGGVVSCSRPIVDNKWLVKTRQVGKSGLKVKPKFYLAVGISGAPEHIEGMKDSELIVAINTDPNAPIFDHAHYGIVGDLFDVVPALTDKL